MMSLVLFLSIVLCLIVGSAIDTGNICVVRAADDLAAGKPSVAVSTLFACAVAAMVFFLNTKLGLLGQDAPWSYPTLLTLAGAACFAIGALLNGACAIGTLGRLARGDVGYLATAVGALAVVLLMPRAMLAGQTPDVPVLTGATWLGIILASTVVLMILSRRHLRVGRLCTYAIIGIAAGLVTNWQGNWTWLGLVQAVAGGSPVRFAAVACLVAVLLGALLTALVKGRYHFVRPNPRTMLREAAGGGFMAAGALLIPGGNDTLLVFGIPSGSPHAIISYAMMFGGILVAFRVRHVLAHRGAATARAAPSPLRTG